MTSQDHDDIPHIMGEREECPGCRVRCYCNRAGYCLWCKATNRLVANVLANVDGGKQQDHGREVLLCGGPAAGRWVIVDGGATEVVVPTFTDYGIVDDGENAAVGSPMRRTTYFLVSLRLVGRMIYVAFPAGTPTAECHRLAVKALFRDEMASRLGA